MFEPKPNEFLPLHPAPRAFATSVRAEDPNAPIHPGEKSLLRPDSRKAKELHRDLMGFYLHEIARHSANRIEMATDERFYDNDPWSPAEKAILIGRGQMATNFNVISTTINWLIGTERRGRSDYKVLPRRKEGGKAAERKTQLLKYLSDANNTSFAFSEAFASAIKCGVGWVEGGWQADDEGEPIYARCENWRNMLWDSYAQAADLSDARYITRTRWTDLDIARRMFPGSGELLRQASVDAGMFFNGMLDQYGDEPMDAMEQMDIVHSSASGLSADHTMAIRSRVRLVETWFRKPVLSRVLSGGDFNGEIFDENSPGHLVSLDEGASRLVEKVKSRVFVAIFTTTGLLHVAASPYRHNKLPFTPIWCYRRATDRMPYGLVRGLRDLQTHINKAASKAQFILSTNRTIMEKGAVDDLDEFEDEAARPDAIIVVNPGKKLEMNVDRSLSDAHLEIMNQMIAMVQRQSGVTDESLGRTTNTVSGKAIIARQDQGALATAEPFDNLRYSRKAHGEKEISLVEQFMHEKKAFRITNMRGTPEFITINDGLPDNDIALTKADFVISEQDWNATMRQAQVTELIEFVARVAPGQPELLMSILDLIAESMDIPNREEIVRRIRQVTGQKDPDADPDAQPTPEEAAQMAMKQEQIDLAKRLAEAEVAKTEGEGAAAQARAEQSNSMAMSTKIDALLKALEAAVAAMSVPQAAPIADQILAVASGPGAAPPPMPTPPPMPPGAMPVEMAPPQPQQHEIDPRF